MRRKERQHGLGKAWAIYGVGLAAILVVAGIWVHSMTTPTLLTGSPTTTAFPWTPTNLPVPTQPQSQENPSTGASASPNSADPSPTPTQSSPAATPTRQATPTTPAAPEFTYSDLALDSVSASGKLHRFIVEIERGVELDPNDTAREVFDVLNDPRSWAGSGKIRFSAANKTSKADYIVSILTAAAAENHCGTSPLCKHDNRLVISQTLWRTHPNSFENPQVFHAYLINHSFGYVQDKTIKKCSSKGKLADVMQAQWSDLAGCKANAWVYN
ncbi:MAG: DUF3152 domain-containing protein [Propionibacteriaceae bacterium]|nr:DUF3152 domain-containing protein [Propionibacteriaceae bacterium]